MLIIGLLYLFFVYLLGSASVRFFLKGLSPFILILNFLTGVLSSAWITFLGALFFAKTDNPLLYANIIFFFIASGIIGLSYRKHKSFLPNFFLYLSSLFQKIKRRPFFSAFWIALFLFFLFLMYHSFSYNPTDGTFYIAEKSWSDFASHIANIRSFSFGHNLPPESPLYAGEFLRYHFLLWFFTANLEFLGIQLHHALNIFTALSLLVLMFNIFLLTKILTKKESVAILAIILFLLNGSLAFYRLIDWGNLISGTWENIVQHFVSNQFLSSGLPFRGEDWGMHSLNIFTNQRHLPFSLVVFSSLLILLFTDTNDQVSQRSKRKYIYIGIMTGLMPLVGGMTFLSLAIVLSLFFLFSRQRTGLFLGGIIALILALPQLYVMRDPSGNYPAFNPGYIFQPTLENFLLFLGIIFGAKLFFFIIGTLVSKKEGKTLALLTFPIFIFPFLFQLGNEQIHGHKFFNIWLVVAYPFIALGLIYLIQRLRVMPLKILIAIVALVALTGTGFLDTIAIAKDPQMTFSEKSDSLFQFVKNQTPKDAVFLTDEYWHSPIVYAGRKLLLGNGYIPWSFGYDAHDRIEKIETMFGTKDKNVFCKLAREFSIGYVVLDKNTKYKLDNKSFFDEQFLLVFERKNPQQFIYSVQRCHTLNNINK